MRFEVCNYEISEDLYKRNLPAVAVPTEYSNIDTAFFDNLDKAIINFNTQIIVINPLLIPLFAGTKQVFKIPSINCNDFVQFLGNEPTAYYNALANASPDTYTFNDITYYIIVTQCVYGGGTPLVPFNSVNIIFYSL